MRKGTMIVAAALAAAVAGCQTMQDDGGAAMASAQLKPTKGNKAYGEVTFEQAGGKVIVLANVAGLKPNSVHGFHIHEVGDCSSADGMSTKGHFNPQGKPHGHPDSTERHAGDLPSLKADKKGKAKLRAEMAGITVSPGANSIVGRGLIVHADPDDNKTQPTGNAGARIACGVIQPL